MKLKSAKEEKQWLKDLQCKLCIDRDNEDSNASPLFYTIADTRKVYTSGDYADAADIWDFDYGQSMSMVDLVVECSKDTIEYLNDKYDLGLTDVSESTIFRNMDNFNMNIKEIVDYINKVEGKNLELHYYEKEYNVPVKGTMFLTRYDAQQHLDANYYHYTEDGHTYAQTAFRSPEYEHLLLLLHSIDWDHSYIELLPDSEVKFYR